MAPAPALYLRSLNINGPEPKAHDDLAGAAQSDCQMFLLLCKGDLLTIVSERFISLTEALFFYTIYTILSCLQAG